MDNRMEINLSMEVKPGGHDFCFILPQNIEKWLEEMKQNKDTCVKIVVIQKPRPHLFLSIVGLEEKFSLSFGPHSHDFCANIALAQEFMKS